MNRNRARPFYTGFRTPPLFWIAAAVFLAGAALAALLFRTGPLPVNPDVETSTVH